MLNAITKANKLLVKFWPFLIIIGLLRTNIRINDVTVIASSIGMVLGLCLEIALCAKIVSSVKGEHSPSIPNALKQNTINYLIVIVVLVSPILFLQFFLRLTDYTSIEKLIASTTVAAFISCLSIYVFPIIFLKRINLIAIPVGYAYLFKNLGFNLPLFGLTILSFAVTPLVALIIKSVGSNIALIYVIIITVNLFSTALMVLVFASATYVICSSTKELLPNEV